MRIQDKLFKNNNKITGDKTALLFADGVYKNNSIILLVDPYFVIGSSNTAGIAYLRGCLQKHNFESQVINYNKLINSFLTNEYIELIKKILNSKKIFFNDQKNDARNHVLHFLLARFYNLGPETIWQEIDKIKIFERLFDQTLSEKLNNIKYVGISITYSYQVLFSLLIVDYIRRKKNKEIKVIIGGSLLTSSVKDFLALFSLRPIVDCLAVGEGESILLNIVRGESFSKISNLYFLSNKKYIKSSVTKNCLNFSDSPSPIYESGDRVFLQYCKKCYWGKCNFCIADKNYLMAEQNKRSMASFIADIVENNRIIKNNKSPCTLVDSSITKNFIEIFHEEATKDPRIKNRYSAYLRFDKWVDEKILRMARECGFVYFGCGVETFNSRLQEVINKGYEIEKIWEILNLFKKLNINLSVFFIIGIPTQTKKELIEDLRLIKKMAEKYPNIKKIELTPFSVKPGTPVYKNPEKYNIKILDNSSVFLGNHYGYRQINKGAISVFEALKITSDYTGKYMRNFKNIIYIWN